MLKNLLKVKSIITLSLTFATIAVLIMSVSGTVSITELTQNPFVICIISAFIASYTSLYVANKDKADEIIQGTVDNQNKIISNWSQEDIDKVMQMNRQEPVPERQAEPVGDIPELYKKEK
ncbi:MAG: hypothetical protein LBI63_05670 [Candidatus Ancillula sp.]|jgi:hypothetical protein|nr:hypothetical protein [Candidatus Ancillula sp.]